MSNPMSRTGAEWVSAPTARYWTPVSATARASVRLSPPDASSSARPRRKSDDLAQLGQPHVVEQDEVGAGVDDLARLFHRVDLDLERQAGVGLADEPERLHHATGRDDVVVLDERGVRQRHAVVVPPPQRTAYFCSARSPGTVLRVSRMRAPVPSTASTHRRVSEATPES